MSQRDDGRVVASQTAKVPGIGPDVDDATMERYPILRWFKAAHLSPELRQISEPFCELAVAMARTLPVCEETSAGLRRLLEAKDCCVRARLAG